MVISAAGGYSPHFLFEALLYSAEKTNKILINQFSIIIFQKLASKLQ